MRYCASSPLPTEAVRLGLACCLALHGGCASAPAGASYAPDKVLARSEGLASRPGRVSEIQSAVDMGERFNFIGMVEVPGDSRVQKASARVKEATGAELSW